MKILRSFFVPLLFVCSFLAQADVLTFVNYYDNDQLGSPVTTTNEQGRLLSHTDYYPYGWRERSEQSIGYTGHAQDSSSELVYMGSRHYDPVIGRFLAVDPVGPVASVPASFNRYAYAQNNPYRYSDPNGEWVEDAVLGIPSLILGTVSLADNYENGRWLAATVDVVGIVADGAAIALPGVPGGAGLTIAGSRKGASALVTQSRKRGPSTDPDAPHNAKIREIGARIKDEDGEILAGGGLLPEKVVPTPGGHKNSRRPDIIYRDCEGNLCGINVGRTKADGSPVTREQKALEDLNVHGGLPTTFERYD